MARSVTSPGTVTVSAVFKLGEFIVLIRLKFQPQVFYGIGETGVKPTQFRNITDSCVCNMSPCISTADC